MKLVSARAWLSFLLGSGFLGLSSIAAAGDTIQLNAGDSITIKPGKETTVTCSDDTTSIIDKYCVCVSYGAGYMVDLKKYYVYSNGKNVSIDLGKFNQYSQCEVFRATSEPCQH